MSKVLDTVPISVLMRNTSAVFRRVQQTKRAVSITRRGQELGVVVRPIPEPEPKSETKPTASLVSRTTRVRDERRAKTAPRKRKA